MFIHVGGALKISRSLLLKIHQKLTHEMSSGDGYVMPIMKLTKNLERNGLTATSGKRGGRKGGTLSSVFSQALSDALRFEEINRIKLIFMEVNYIFIQKPISCI